MARPQSRISRSRAGRTTSRRIYFYRALCGQDASGSPIRFDAQAYLAAVDAIPWHGDKRYSEIEDGSALALWVEDDLQKRPRARFGLVRRDALPAIEKEGALRDLTLRADEGLVEQVHLRFFANNILGADFNFYGPRLARLRKYFSVVAPNAGPEVEFGTLVNRSALAALEDLPELHSLELQVHRSFLEAEEALPDDILTGLSALGRIGHPEFIGIQLRLGRRTGSRSLASTVRAWLRGLVGASDGSLVDRGVSRLVVAGYARDARKLQTVDLLSDRFVTEERVIFQSKRGRTLDAPSVYEAIEKAYVPLRRDLERAAAVI